MSPCLCHVTEKRISLRLSLLSSYLPDFVVRNDPRQKEFHAVLWVLVQYQLYLVTYGFHRKNIPTTTRSGSAAEWSSGGPEETETESGAAEEQTRGGLRKLVQREGAQITFCLNPKVFLKSFKKLTKIQKFTVS